MGFLTNGGPAAASMMSSRQPPEFTPDMLTFEQPRNVFQTAPAESPPQRRTSALNVLGQMADWVAQTGGAEPMYQSSIDAENERARQAEQDAFEREKFGLQKQKYGLDVKQAETELADSQREAIGKAAIGLRALLDREGPEGVRRAAPQLQRLFGLSDEQTRFVASDPETAALLLQGLAEGGDGIEAGLSLVYGTDQNGNTVAYQPLKSGGLRRATPDEGVKLTPGLMQVDQGDRKVILNNRGGQEIATYGVAGGPEKGEVPIFGEDGKTIVGYRLAPGSKPQREMQSDADANVQRLTGLEGAFESGRASLARAREGLTAMKNNGGLIDSTNPSQGPLGRAMATLYQNSPMAEAIMNSDSFSGRQLLDNARRDLVYNFESARQQASGAGLQLSAKLIDAAKEVEGRLDAITNVKDWESATKALDDYEASANRYYAMLQDEMQRAKAKQQSARSGGLPSKIEPPARAATKSSVSNW